MNRKDYIAILIEGENQSQLVGANFVYKLEEYVHEYNLKFCIFGGSDFDFNDMIWGNQKNIFFYTCKDGFSRIQREEYLLVMSLDIYPKVHRVHRKELHNYAKLDYLVAVWENFEKQWENDLYFRDAKSCKPYYYRRLIIQGKNVINACDIGNKLGMSKKYQLAMHCESKYIDVLEKNNLKNKLYIIIHREGGNGISDMSDTRLWSLKYFEELLELIKIKYPNLIIVQISKPGILCRKIEGVDLDLSSLLNWDEIKVLLKHAILLIDSDSEMVHLRSLLRGEKSLVLFGPTPKDYFSLEDNFNLMLEGCPYWCAGLKEGWETICANEKEPNICMRSIKPEMVFDYITKVELERV